MMHGLFHRIQPELGLIAEDGFNEHLDTLDGRLWNTARMASAPPGGRIERRDRVDAIADALAFRRERRRLSPGAAANERRDEIREGLASYTGIAAWATSPADARRAAASALAAGNRSRRSSVISRRIPAPATGCCSTTSCRDGANRFVAPRTSATCSPPPPASRRRPMLPWQRHATMARRCERRRRRAIGRSSSASPRCADASSTARADDACRRQRHQRHHRQRRHSRRRYRVVSQLHALGAVGPSQRRRRRPPRRRWGHMSVPVTAPLDGTTLQGDGWTATLNAGWVVRPASRPGSYAIVPETRSR